LPGPIIAALIFMLHLGASTIMSATPAPRVWQLHHTGKLGYYPDSHPVRTWFERASIYPVI
jgi:hypothetical protein